MFRQLTKPLFPLTRPSSSRFFSDIIGGKSEGEKRIAELLKKRFSPESKIEVEDISGGCGSMYKINVVSPDFQNKLKVQQHRMITDTLKTEIKEMHGLVIETKAS